MPSTVQSSRPARGEALIGARADQQRRRVGRMGVSLRPHRQHAIGREVFRAHRLAVLRHHPQAAAGVRRALQVLAWTRAERANREQQRGPHRRERGTGQTDEQAPPSEGRCAFDLRHGLLERLLGGGDRVTFLRHLVLRGRVLGPRHDAEPDAAGHEEKAHALELRLPASPVHDGKHDRRDRAHRKRERRRPLPAAHGSLALAGARVPIHATIASNTLAPKNHATNPSGTGPMRPIGRPPGSSGARRYST